MFRDRNEELSHLIELYQKCSNLTIVGDVDLLDDHLQHNKTTIEVLRTEVESFSSAMINYMLEDKDLDLQFANKLYEFEPKLFLQIFNAGISQFYLQIGFTETLRIIGEVKYFSQAIEGYKTIFDQIKENLSNFHEQSFKLREKLEKLQSMKDFAKLTEEEKSCIIDMINILEPYSILPKPVKSKRDGNWAEHYYHLGLIEKQFEDEKSQFYSLFRKET